MSRLSKMEPLLLPVLPVAPPVAMLVYVSPVMGAGKEAFTRAPVTLLGPGLVTTMVYVVVLPGTAVAVPSLTVTLRSTVGFSVSVSLLLLLPVLGSGAVPGAVTVAMLVSVPVAAGLMWAMTV